MFSSVQSLTLVRLFATPWTAARQASLSITNSWSLLKLMSIKSVTPSNRPILCGPLLFPPSIIPSIKVFSSESVLCIRWPKYWSFSFSITPSNEYSWLISFRTDLLTCKSMDCSTPGFPVHHQLLELAQTHIHQVSDEIQLSKGLSRVFSNTTVQNHQFFNIQLSLWSNSHIHT